MSRAITRKGKKVKTIKVPTRSGKWIQRTSGTADASTAAKIGRMVQDLRRTYDILDRIEAGSISLPELFVLWEECRRDVDAIRQRLNDVDLEPFVAEWHKTAAVSGKKKRSSDTVAHYYKYLRSFMPAGIPFSRSSYTADRIQLWIDQLEASAATKRKAASALSSFTVFLSRRSLVPKKIMRDVELPEAGAPRLHYLTTEEARALADAQPGQYRAFSALLAGSGIEVSVALGLRRRDVDREHREIRAAGTKTHVRDRIVRVAEWAWSYLEELLEEEALLPDARLFDAILDRWEARDVHAEAIAELVKRSPVYTGYTMRDQRHTYAVRAIRAGTPAELVARQLGHANAVLVHKVYGRFIPAQEERNRWEQIAHNQDKKSAGIGAP
jgi:integrase